ncbi:MAG TPA: isoprenylcysteine carboxylmethyltransferase family protein [Gemmatimonadaceae bacterium]
MRPLPFAWPYALVFWAVYLWAFAPEWRIVRSGVEGVKRDDSKDSGSLRLLLGGQWIALLIAFPIAFVTAFAFPPRLQVPLFAVGISLLLLGSLLRRYCWRTLGEYFTGDVRARPDQPVIRSGPYRLVRHPSYTAGMMMFIGIGLSLGNWISFVLLTLSTVTLYSYRVSVEERALLETIGEPYGAYMKECKRFIPYVV